MIMENAIKTLGLHDVRVRLHPEVSVTVTVNVARSLDEAETQLKTGVAVTGMIDDDDDESEHSVSKDGVRRRLADVARVHPECRPSRGTLKQVFNRMFEMRR